MAFLSPACFRLSIDGKMNSADGEKLFREEYFVRVNTSGDELEFPGVKIRIKNSDRQEGALTAVLEAASYSELSDLVVDAVVQIPESEMPRGDGMAGRLEGNQFWLGDRLPLK